MFKILAAMLLTVMFVAGPTFAQQKASPPDPQKIRKEIEEARKLLKDIELDARDDIGEQYQKDIDRMEEELAAFLQRQREILARQREDLEQQRQQEQQRKEAATKKAVTPVEPNEAAADVEKAQPPAAEAANPVAGDTQQQDLFKPVIPGGAAEGEAEPVQQPGWTPAQRRMLQAVAEYVRKVRDETQAKFENRIAELENRLLTLEGQVGEKAADRLGN